MPESSASAKPIAEKLLIKPGYRVFILNPPRGYRTALRPLPEGTHIFTEPQEDLDMIQLFVTCKEDLQAELARRKNLLKSNGLLWVMFPKGGARLKGDLNRDTIDSYAQTVGLKGVSIVSVDDKWSALRLRVHEHAGGEIRGED